MFFFQAEDGIRDLVRSRGLGDVYKRQHYAYLKISEGCNHRCTFCIIPSMRGDLVSRPIGDVLKEAKALFEGGVKELPVSYTHLTLPTSDLV